MGVHFQAKNMSRLAVFCSGEQRRKGTDSSISEPATLIKLKDGFAATACRTCTILYCMDVVKVVCI